jgi:hypothetical protein
MRLWGVTETGRAITQDSVGGLRLGGLQAANPSLKVAQLPQLPNGSNVLPGDIILSGIQVNSAQVE